MMNGYEYTGMNAILAGSFRAAIYCRLSKDDDLDGESASIANQRDMLEHYCEKQGWEVVEVYQDDGYTGLNMERPDLKRMIKAIERRQVNLVITKDLSRLGRNYLQTGYLIEDFFPRNGVRYIAMNDGIDTLRENNDIAPFKNILNEMYSKDISKKVHSSYLLKAQKGEFTGCVAPFGYRKDPEDKNHLLVDEETAPIVRQIFRWALEGHGPNFIRRRLEEQKVPCPTWWNRERGIRNVRTKWEKKDPENGRYMWDFSVIKDILMNPVYTGAIASQKKDYRFKIGTIGEKKPQDWIVVEQRHEPLIDSKSFAIVQDKLKSRQRPRQDGETSLFAGLIKCGECGKSLTIRTTHAKHPQQIYACKTYGAFGKNHCTQHRVEYDTLYRLVLNKIRECASAALMDGEAIAGKLTDTCEAEQKGQREAWERSLAKDEERMEVLEKMVLRLYEDMMAGRISDTNFNLMLGRTQTEQAELKARVEEARKRLSDEAKIESDARQWIDAIQEYADITELDAATLNRLIKEIVVHEHIDSDKTRHISIEIHFNLKPIPEVEQVKG
ncbi:recombinase family protein [Flavonifractor plautii]|uniref:recombinase family protein n=1 Tax=Flavonifractor plautii TaxID=292800 RepID=UPI001D00B7E8|nr:recombinase family protein [Flavonifractor plautii]MCB5584216.1 recombinase family protein [Flavonifractor plautii]